MVAIMMFCTGGRVPEFTPAELCILCMHAGNDFALLPMVFIFTVGLWEIAGIVILAAFFALIKAHSCAI
jgi:hypothetical protein